MTAKELPGRYTISVTMRNAHTSLPGKRQALQVLAGLGDNLLTVPLRAHQNAVKLSPSKVVNFFAASSWKAEEWPSG